MSYRGDTTNNSGKNDFLVDSDLKKSSHSMEKTKMCCSLKHI